VEKQYCTSCGAAVSATDSFCFKCGSSIETPKAKVPDLSPVYPVAEETHYVKSRKIKRHSKKFVFIPVIILMILVPIITVTAVTNLQRDLGTLEYEIPDTGITAIELSITNDIGSVDVIYDDSISNLFEAEITVRGGLRASIEDAVNFNHEIVGDSINVNFFFDNHLANLFRMKRLIHNIDIYINPTAEVAFDVECSTGSIEISLHNEDDVVINGLELVSSTGSVKFYGTASDNLNIGDVLLSSSTGSITFDLFGTTNAFISGLQLDTSTGSIHAELGEYTTLNCSVVNLYTSTGSITLVYSNIIYYNELDWSVSTSTGSISLFIEQTILSSTNASMDFMLDTSTGSITTSCELNSDIGVEMDGATSTGSVNLPNGHDYYLSPDFHLKTIQFSFTMSTSTGSITGFIIYA
jgi:hypothetical protein